MRCNRRDDWCRPMVDKERDDCVNYLACLDVAAKADADRVCPRWCRRYEQEQIPFHVRVGLVGGGRCHSSMAMADGVDATVADGRKGRTKAYNWTGAVFEPFLVLGEANPVGPNRMWTVICQACGRMSVRSASSFSQWRLRGTAPTCKACGAHRSRLGQGGGAEVQRLRADSNRRPTI